MLRYGWIVFIGVFKVWCLVEFDYSCIGVLLFVIRFKCVVFGCVGVLVHRVMDGFGVFVVLVHWYVVVLVCVGVLVCWCMLVVLYWRLGCIGVLDDGVIWCVDGLAYW